MPEATKLHFLNETGLLKVLKGTSYIAPVKEKVE